MTAHAKTVRTRCGVLQTGRNSTATLLTRLVAGYPCNFERWPSGHIYVSNGLQDPYRWDGIRTSFIPIGLETPSGTPSLTTSGAGSVVTGLYKIYVRFVDADGQVSPLSTVSAEYDASGGVAGLAYSALPVPTDPRVTKRQILRNTNGQYTVFYVDIETTDLAATSGFTSTKDDDTLSAGTEVPLFDLDGRALSGQWVGPRDDKPILVHHKNRMFAAGEVAYSEGNAQVTLGSTTVTGTATAWTTDFANREFIVLGLTSPKAYTISSVSGQVLTLSEVYRGPTDLFASYVIRPPAAQRNTIYFSNAGYPEQWLPANGVAIEEAGDAITALIPAPAFLFVGLRDGLYRFAFDQDPGTDGSFSRVATRGCINQRTWVRANESFYVLDRQGIYSFSDQGMEQSSLPIQDVFSRKDVGDVKIDWTRSDLFHAAWDAEEHVVRFYVTLGGPGCPRHALCHNYLSKSWWVEEYPVGIGASAVQVSKARVFLAGPSVTLYEQGIGNTDGPDPSGYKTAGTITSSTTMSFTDSTLSLPSSGIAGAPVVITAGRGKGQLRIIESVSGTRVNITTPWSVKPDTTSTYQVGGIQWSLRTGLYRHQIGAKEPIEANWLPTGDGLMNIRLYDDYSNDAREWAIDRPLADGDDDGVSYTKNDADLAIDLKRDVGWFRAYVEVPTGPNSRRPYVVALEASGVSTPYGFVLYSVSLGGAG